jgi:hypothetical protein
MGGAVRRKEVPLKSLRLVPFALAVASLSIPLVLPRLGHADPPDWKPILDRAIQAQGGRGLGTRIRAIDGRFEVISNEDGHRFEAKVRQSYRRTEDGKEQFRSEIRERGAGEWAVKGFDGKDYWLRDSKRALRLRGREYRQDIRQIQQDIEYLRNTIDFFFLENLTGEGVRFRRLAPSDGEEARESVLERTAEGQRTMRLHFDAKDHRLTRVVLLPWDDDPRTVTFRMSGRCGSVYLGDERLEELFVPRYIKVFYDDETTPSTDSFVNEIRINGDLPEDLFRLEE